MWVYEKKLEYPVKIKNPNPELAKLHNMEVQTASSVRRCGT